MVNLEQLLQKLNHIPLSQWEIQGNIDNACVKYHEPLEGTHDSWAYLTRKDEGYELVFASVSKDGKGERTVLGHFDNDIVVNFADCLRDSYVYQMRAAHYD